MGDKAIPSQEKKRGGPEKAKSLPSLRTVRRPVGKKGGKGQSRRATIFGAV